MMRTKAVGSRKILLISYHYGQNGETGGFRWTNLVPLLEELGWTFDIIALDRNAVASTALVADVVEGRARVHLVRPSAVVQILLEYTVNALSWLSRRLRIARRGAPSRAPATYRQAVSEPPTVPARMANHSVSRRVGFIVEGIMDTIRMLSWARQATRVGRRLMSQGEYLAVVVSSPPHLTQITGLAAIRGRTTSFVPDFRDPWLYGLGTEKLRIDTVSRMVGNWLESRTTKRATVVVHNTDQALKAVSSDPAAPTARRVTVTNGYDDPAEPGYPDRDHFIVAFTGHLHAWMDPRAIFAACSRLLKRHAAARSAMRLVFMGTAPAFDGVAITTLAEGYGLADVFEIRARGSRSAAQSLQESAALLVAYDCTHKLCVPMKFYDYARLRGVMLLIGNPDGAMADAARQLGIAVHRATDHIAMDKTMDSSFQCWRDGHLTTVRDVEGIFSRRRQAAQFDHLFRSLDDFATSAS